MVLRNTVQSIIFVATIMILSLFMLSGSALAEGASNQNSLEADAKNLTPADGKSLVYFFYGRSSCRGNLEISLDGASSFLNKDMFVLWEVPSGTHEIKVALPPRGISTNPVPITADLAIETKAGSVYYYRLLHEGEAGDDDYRLVPIRTSAGQKYVAGDSLAGWFEDGAVVYQNQQLLSSAE